MFSIGSVLFFMKKRKSGLLLFGAMVGNAFILEILKTFIYSSRPMNGVVLETGNSFPSGHVTSTVVLFGLFIFFSLQFFKNVLTKFAAISFFVIIIFFVGFTRIYLNVHWFSDVIGGYFLGVFWITFCIAMAPRIIKIYKRLLEKKTNPEGTVSQGLLRHWNFRRKEEECNSVAIVVNFNRSLLSPISSPMFLFKNKKRERLILFCLFMVVF